MPIQKVTSDVILKELEFNFSRSSGPGGQHVNKVNTKVGLRFDVSGSKILNEEQKELLMEKLANKLTKEGVLVLSSQEARSQLLNKELVIEKLDKLL
ncbi:MAG: aminoacyl-tRNA hydrolase, partial [Flavobacteriaceae bacterium]|nr:aminoacyl-tRNA hydrolase [Flavobacteriaceae bacterium]